MDRLPIDRPTFSTLRSVTGRRVAAVRLVALLIVVMVAVSLPLAARADGTADDLVSHTLGIALSFPDMGLAVGEELCVAVYPGDVEDFADTPPLDAQCAGQGTSWLFFEDLEHGAYQVLVPAPGSELNPARYQGQVIDTDIPDDPNQSAFGIPVSLALTSASAGTTGIVEVTVYGCPPGTNGGGDATAWETECTSLIGGTAVELAGIGSIEDTSAADVTAVDGDEFGRVKFANLPAGDYEVAGDVPGMVTTDPAYFVVSSIDGSTGALAPDDTIDVRPAETVAVDVFLVLDDDDAAAAPLAAIDSGSPPIDGASEDDPVATRVDDPGVTGGLDADPAPAATPVVAAD